MAGRCITDGFYWSSPNAVFCPKHGLRLEKVTDSCFCGRPRDAHQFTDSFPFCEECGRTEEQSNEDREKAKLESVAEQAATGN